MASLHSRARLNPPAAARAIWRQAEWPHFVVDSPAIASDLEQARHEQGRLLGQLKMIGFDAAQGIEGEIWQQEALATAAIEGEQLDLASVRSSVQWRLGLAERPTVSRNIDGLVEVLHDAMRDYAQPLNDDRLHRWHAALFPYGVSGIARIAVGRYRDHADAMQIVSGPLGKQVVHYTAPPSAMVPREMQLFLTWFETSKATLHGLVRAALAHLWFETIHPFEDGNGRLGRAVTDLAMAQDMQLAQRWFSMSTQLFHDRKGYYEALNAAQHGSLNQTAWVQWFIQTLTASCQRTQAIIDDASVKAEFRRMPAYLRAHERQRKVLDRLLQAGDGGFLGGMTAEKYAKITGVSKATATRDLSDLVAQALLVVQGIGKATRYAVAVNGWHLAPSPSTAPPALL
jgi:Fic family protein